jgi:hypothetical protein
MFAPNRSLVLDQPITTIMKQLLLSFTVSCILLSTTSAQSWSNVGTFSGTSFPSVEAFTTHDNMLIAAGTFKKMAGDSTINNVAAYDGTNWYSVGNFTMTGFGVYAAASYKNELYVAGEFTHVNGLPATRIARWNGSQWDSVAGGLNYLPNPSPAAMTVYKGNLYVGVSNGLAVWDGTSWTYINNVGRSIKTMIVYNDELYLGGAGTNDEFANSNGVIKYDGTTFSGVGGGFPGGNVLAFGIHNNELYAGGDMQVSATDSVNNIARFDGTNWVAVDQGMNSTVNGLVSTVDGLFIGGFFWKVNSTGASANRAAIWNGTGILPLPDNGGSSKAHAYNNHIYTGGAQVRRYSQQITALPETGGTIHAEVYPNPTTGRFTLAMAKAEAGTRITVTNIQGQRILMQPLDGEHAVVDLSHQPRGLYLINVTSPSASSTAKVLLQ